MDENQEQKERGMIRDLLEHLQKRWEEEDEVRDLIEQMQRHLDEARTEVTKSNGRTEFSGNTLKLSTKK